MRIHSLSSIAPAKYRTPAPSADLGVAAREIAVIFEQSSPIKRTLLRALRELEVETVCSDSFAASIELQWPNAPRAVLLGVHAFLDWASLHGARLADATRPGPIKIVCAGRYDYPAILDALGEGADDYLVAPFDGAVLHSKLACWGLCPL